MKDLGEPRDAACPEQAKRAEWVAFFATHQSRVPRASLLFLPTNKLPCHLAEVPFRELPELIVPPRLLADHQFATVVARVKPFGVRHRAAAGAIEVNPSSEFDEGTALRQFGGFFVLHANPGSAQAVLLSRDRADQNLISAGELRRSPASPPPQTRPLPPAAPAPIPPPRQPAHLSSWEDRDRAISTPHTLWAKTRFLSTAGCPR